MQKPERFPRPNNNNEMFGTGRMPETPLQGMLHGLSEGFNKSIIHLLAIAGVTLGIGMVAKTYEEMVAQPKLNQVNTPHIPSDIVDELKCLNDAGPQNEDRAWEVKMSVIPPPESQNKLSRRILIDSQSHQFDAGIIPGSISIKTLNDKPSGVAGDYTFTSVAGGRVSVDKEHNAVLIQRSSELVDEPKLNESIFGKLITFTKGKDGAMETFQVTTIINTDNKEGGEELHKKALDTVQITDTKTVEELQKALQRVIASRETLDREMEARYTKIDQAAQKAKKLIEDPEFIRKIENGTVELVADGHYQKGFKYDEYTIVTKIIGNLDSMRLSTSGKEMLVGRKYSIISDSQNGISVIRFEKPVFNKKELLSTVNHPPRIQETYLIGNSAEIETPSKKTIKVLKGGARAGVLNNYGATRRLTGNRREITGYVMGRLPVYETVNTYDYAFSDMRMNIALHASSANIGAPIFDTDGQVVGVIGATYKMAKDGSSFVRGSDITTDMIKALIDKHQSPSK